jgi:endo-1,4-beta-xylanase
MHQAHWIVPLRAVAAAALVGFVVSACSDGKKASESSAVEGSSGAGRSSGAAGEVGASAGNVGGGAASGTGATAGIAGRASETGGTAAIAGRASVPSGGSSGDGGRRSGASGAAGASIATSGRGGTGTSGNAGNGGSSGSAGAGGRPPPLKKFVGNITTRGQVRSDFEMYWDQITPENEGKWGSVEGTRNQMNWSGLDRIHDYAKQHNIPFKQHNFVWGAQQPSWIAGLSQAEQRAEVEEWIRLFCERYPDTQLIDVVNEPPPHTTPPYTAALGGAGTSGYDWIVQSFKWARQYCPNAILILNDYNTIEYANDNNHFIDIVNRIKAAGAPIDATGAQAHAAHSLSTSTVQMYLDKLATSTGLPVYISEYDIDEADDNKQRDVMQSQFTMFWNDDHVKGITVWGYVVGQTWLTNSGLMNSTGSMRPAMTWLMQFLNRP